MGPAAAAAARRRLHAPTARGRRGASAHHRGHRKSGVRRYQPLGGWLLAGSRREITLYDRGNINNHWTCSCRSSRGAQGQTRTRDDNVSPLSAKHRAFACRPDE